MSDKTIIKLAEEISFRLLATKNHDDFDWLVEQLSDYIEDEQLKIIKDMEDLYGPNKAYGV
tara:strand:- start:1282 stop:1464 length:183 start_codon:yes stop_codon:yes gene_type:complete